jgi:orotidine-5'-phosphate decarboxylase
VAIDVSTCIPIVALDVSSARDARTLVARLGDSCRFYKVGLELFATEGPDIVRALIGEGHEVFVDLKLHDIPNTVRSASRAVASLGASLLTVHASGGVDMMRAAVQGATEGGVPNRPCRILGVTVLTSHSAQTQAAAWGRPSVDVDAEVERLAGDTETAGAAGIVCSGHEAKSIRARFGTRLGLLIPGIRLAGGDAHDQQRVMTPEAAASAGATWIILGRAVTAAPDPRAAMSRVHEELATV